MLCFSKLKRFQKFEENFIFTFAMLGFSKLKCFENFCEYLFHFFSMHELLKLKHLEHIWKKLNLDLFEAEMLRKIWW